MLLGSQAVLELFDRSWMRKVYKIGESFQIISKARMIYDIFITIKSSYLVLNFETSYLICTNNTSHCLINKFPFVTIYLDGLHHGSLNNFITFVIFFCQNEISHKLITCLLTHELLKKQSFPYYLIRKRVELLTKVASNCLKHSIKYYECLYFAIHN